MTDTAWVNEQLAEIRFHWSGAYIIMCSAFGHWTAERRDNGALLAADDAGDLWKLIRADYAAYPVPRPR